MLSTDYIASDASKSPDYPWECKIARLPWLLPNVWSDQGEVSSSFQFACTQSILLKNVRRSHRSVSYSYISWNPYPEHVLCVMAIGTFKLVTQWRYLLPVHWAIVWGKPTWVNQRVATCCTSCLQVSPELWRRQGLLLLPLLQGRWLSSKRRLLGNSSSNSGWFRFDPTRSMLPISRACAVS